MKKLISVLLIIIIVSVCGCLAGCGENLSADTYEQVEAYIEDMVSEDDSKAATKPESTTEAKPVWPIEDGEAVDIFMKNKDMWFIDKDSVFVASYCYGFLDFDFDGVCELVTSVCEGSGKFSRNHYYRIDPENLTVYELAITSPEKSYQTGDVAHDYCFNDLVLYKDIYNGQHKYYGTDLCLNGISERSTSLMDMYIKGGKLLVEPTYVYYYYDARAYGGDVREDYSVFLNNQWRTTTEEKYNKIRSMYADASVNVRYEFVNGEDMEGVTYTTQKSLMESSYSAFTFDGYVGG